MQYDDFVSSYAVCYSSRIGGEYTGAVSPFSVSAVSKRKAAVGRRRRARRRREASRAPEHLTETDRAAPPATSASAPLTTTRSNLLRQHLGWPSSGLYYSPRPLPGGPTRLGQPGPCRTAGHVRQALPLEKKTCQAKRSCHWFPGPTGGSI